MNQTYASLHNHTEFSNLKLIDSINRAESLIQYAYDCGLEGVAITDHDSVSGHIRAINYYDSHFDDEQKSKFKLILGNEIYLCREGLCAENHAKGEKFYHLILIALDEVGHEQLRKLSSRAWSRAYMKNIMRTPTYSSDLFEIVGENPGHLVCSTACLGGYCGSKFFEEDYDAISRHLQMMEALFGKGNFFIELQPSNMEDQIDYNKYMIDTYWGKYPFIVTTDSHYLKKEDREIHKFFLNSKSSNDREVDSFYSSAYMMTAAEIVEYLESYVDKDKITAMFNNTKEICRRVQYYNLKHSSIIPKIKYEQNSVISPYIIELVNKYSGITEHLKQVIEQNHNADIYLLNLLAEPWEEKIIGAGKDEEKYVKELDYEFEQLYAISHSLNQDMSDYFITMSKMIDIMWEDGDSIVGPGRGSAGSSIINYLLGISQIDPLAQSVPLPFWRFLHSSRVGLPDVDIDTESNKRVRVFNKVQKYFQSIGGDLIHVCTFGTEGSKSALNTAARGLGIDEDVASYVTVMIPNARGFDWTLSQCYYGDDEHPAIKAFKEEIDKYPMWWEVASAIEGLITRLGCHASGVLALNDPVWKYNSVMKTSKGILVTAYDLEDTEELSGVKYDYLTVQALDKIRTCMNLLLEDGKIQWQGSLRKTYDKYIHPDVINYDNEDMWNALYRREIPSCFQFDTQVGGQAIHLIHPSNLAELTAGNGLMRLMANEDGELPLDIYVKHKNNIQTWYDEMEQEGLSKEEQNILRKYLDIVYGVAVSQETMMLLSMDKNISNFDMGEANILRKAVAKKKFDVLQKGKELFYSKGLDAGTSMKMLDYVWNKQIMLQAG